MADDTPKVTHTYPDALVKGAEPPAGCRKIEGVYVPMRDGVKLCVDIYLPGGKIVIPGVVSHATNVVEHPELVADRLVQYAEVVGRENVIASTDCGLGGRVHPQIAWAKLQALRDGAALATKRLWG